jgi:hypothetical protein
MIIKGGSRQNRRFFARHLMNGRDNERVRVVGFKGFAHENVDDAFRDMEAVARNTRCKNFFYHADMNPREDERLTDEQWDRAVDTLEKQLGLEGQARIVFEHEKEGRTHRHVIWSRIDLGTMTARSDSLTYQKHEAAAREIERDCGLKPVESVLVKNRDTPRPERRAKDFEGFRAVRTGLKPDQVKAEVTALWERTDSGAAFRAALQDRGYILCRGDRRDFCIVDPAGDEHSLARRISGVKAAAIRERMNDIERDSLPTVAEGRKLADAWAEGDSEAARAVRLKDMDDRLKPFRQSSGETLPEPEWSEKQRAFLEHEARRGALSGLEKAAHEYGQAVKNVARAGQDAYWQSMIGGKPKTEADRLHDLMWGEGKKEPEMER